MSLCKRMLAVIFVGVTLWSTTVPVHAAENSLYELSRETNCCVTPLVQISTSITIDFEVTGTPRPADAIACVGDLITATVDGYSATAGQLCVTVWWSDEHVSQDRIDVTLGDITYGWSLYSGGDNPYTNGPGNTVDFTSPEPMYGDVRFEITDAVSTPTGWCYWDIPTNAPAYAARSFIFVWVDDLKPDGQTEPVLITNGVPVYFYEAVSSNATQRTIAVRDPGAGYSRGVSSCWLVHDRWHILKSSHPSC